MIRQLGPYVILACFGFGRNKRWEVSDMLIRIGAA